MLRLTRLSLPSLTIIAAMSCAGSASAADVAFGEYLASECVTCHQRTGKDSGIPAITGWPPEAFVAVLNSYRTKERDNVVMQTIAARLQDDEVQALAAYFQSLGAPVGAK